MLLVVLCGHQCTSVREWSVCSHLWNSASMNFTKVELHESKLAAIQAPHKHANSIQVYDRYMNIVCKRV